MALNFRRYIPYWKGLSHGNTSLLLVALRISGSCRVYAFKIDEWTDGWLFQADKFCLSPVCSSFNFMLSMPRRNWRHASQNDVIGMGDPSKSGKLMSVLFLRLINFMLNYQRTLEASCINDINKQITCQKHITALSPVWYNGKGISIELSLDQI